VQDVVHDNVLFIFITLEFAGCAETQFTNFAIEELCSTMLGDLYIALMEFNTYNPTSTFAGLSFYAVFSHPPCLI